MSCIALTCFSASFSLGTRSRAFSGSTKTPCDRFFSALHHRRSQSKQPICSARSHTAARWSSPLSLTWLQQLFPTASCCGSSTLSLCSRCSSAHHSCSWMILEFQLPKQLSRLCEQAVSTTNHTARPVIQHISVSSDHNHDWETNSVYRPVCQSKGLQP